MTKSTDLGSRLWDELAADIVAGQGERIELDAAHGGGHVYFFPMNGNGSDSGRGEEVGEVAWFNTLDDFDAFTAFVVQHDLGGVFSWIATSDSLDWRVHKRLHQGLAVGSG